MTKRLELYGIDPTLRPKRFASNKAKPSKDNSRLLSIKISSKSTDDKALAPERSLKVVISSNGVAPTDVFFL